MTEPKTIPKIAHGGQDTTGGDSDPKQLRKQGIRARDSLSPREREERSARIAERIAASAVFRNAKTVLIYDHVRGEVSLDALLTHPNAAGKRFCYPLCVSDTEMIAMVPGAWKTGAFGIREPVREVSEEVPPEEIDLVVCPCTVFDESGGRMGMGAGYYDRYLPKCTGAAVVAAAFEAQKASRLPSAAWDFKMDSVYTESDVYSRSRK